MDLGVNAVMLPELDFEAQIALCRDLGVTHYQLRPRVIPDERRSEPYSNWGNHRFDLTPAGLLDKADSLAAQLRDAGLKPFGTVPYAVTSDADADLKLHMEGAAAVGAGRVRINPEPYPRKAFDFPEYLHRVIERYAVILEWASPLKVKLVMETHSWSVAADPGLAWEICRNFTPEQIGVIFDLPNFAREGNLQPVLAASILGPWVDHCHVGGARRVSSGYDAVGCRVVQDLFCPLTESDLNGPAYLDTLAKAGVQVPLVIEEYTPGVPGETRLRMTVDTLRRWNAARQDAAGGAD